MSRRSENLLLYHWEEFFKMSRLNDAVERDARLVFLCGVITAVSLLKNSEETAARLLKDIKDLEEKVDVWLLQARSGGSIT